MGLLNTVSFWILIISAGIGIFVGIFTHWIVGLILFIVIAGKAATMGLLMDLFTGGLKYHHDRQDNRMAKTMQSIAALKNPTVEYDEEPDTPVKKQALPYYNKRRR